jgi:hypothetical protein
MLEPTIGLEPMTCRLRIRLVDFAIECTRLHRTVISASSTFRVPNGAARKCSEPHDERGKFGASRGDASLN